MKTIIPTFLALATCARLLAQTPVDAYMGDWKGTVTIGGKRQNVMVAMIPHGYNKYEAKVYATFDERVPVEHRLRVVVEEGQFLALDAIPFEMQFVLGTVDNGVVVGAALWKASAGSGLLDGSIAGRIKGTFTFEPFKRTSPTLGLKPPPGAIALFNGENLDAWMPSDAKDSEVKWKLAADAAMQVNGGNIMTREQFTDHKLHLEFRTPYMPQATGQGRGNSGVYLQGRYELQVLDSYGLEGQDNECGGIYQIARPRVNMCFPPLAWQTYDITCRAPRFDANGRKTANALITVRHNGVTIHDNLELPKVTGGALNNKEDEPGPLLLQDHGNPVQYRNIWVLKQ